MGLAQRVHVRAKWDMCVDDMSTRHSLDFFVSWVTFAKDH